MLSIQAQLVARIRKQEQDWRQRRWIILLGSLTSVVGNGLILAKMQRVLALTEKLLGGRSLEAAFYLAALSTIQVMLFWLGAVGLVHAVRNWNGSPVRQLLILLAQRHPE